MYLRHTTLRKDGKVHRCWRLVRKARAADRYVIEFVADRSLSAGWRLRRP